MLKDLLRIFPFAHHRVDMSKAGPYCSYASQRYSLFKRSNGLWESPLLLIRPAQNIVVELIIRIEIDGRMQLLDRLVPRMRENKNGTQVAIEAGRERIGLNDSTGVGIWNQRSRAPRFILAEGDLQFDNRSRRNSYIQNPCADRCVKRRSPYSIWILEGVVCAHVAVC
jgi:hypothetical protein